MSLNDLRRGQAVKVLHIADEVVRVQLLRFDITPGSRVTCYSKVPFGPVVVQIWRAGDCRGPSLSS
jgi:Fe2+ transport system protein FeoA